MVGVIGPRVRGTRQLRGSVGTVTVFALCAMVGAAITGSLIGLLGGAAQWGVDRGRSGIALTVREDRPVAIELYRRSGFVEMSRGRHWRRTA